MSGPKGYDLELERRLQRERELAARRRTWDQLRETLALLRGIAAAHGSEVDITRLMEDAGYDSSRLQAPTESDLDQVEKLTATVGAVGDRVRADASRRAAAAALGNLTRLQEALGGGELVVTSLSTMPSELASTSAGPIEVRDPDVLLDLLTRAGEAASELRDVVLSCEPGDEKAWRAMTRQVTDAVRAESSRLARLRLVDELESLVARVEDPVASADLRARITSASTLAALESRRAEIASAVVESDLKAERAFVLASAIEVWRELGYNVPDGSGPGTAGSAILLQHDDWTDHALQVRLLDGTQQIATNVVTFGDTDPTRDHEVEEDHCADIADFRAGLSARGLSSNLVRAKEPGELPMQQVARPAAARRVTDESSATVTTESQRSSL